MPSLLSSSLLTSLKRRLFWIVSRTGLTLYRWFPIFGAMRASLGVIKRGNTFLVIERNDGRGVCLPGGIAGRKESEVDALRREVQEETGLIVSQAELRMTYSSRADIPVVVSVFAAGANGELKESWEGSPRWMTVPELSTRLIESQQPVIELLTKLSDGEPVTSELNET